MSDPSVERKKSYRWISASKVSYDGLDWNSSDDDSNDSHIYDQSDKDSNRTVENRIETQFDKLPTLPSLNYPDKESTYKSLQKNTEEQQYNSEIRDNGSLRRLSTDLNNDDNALKPDFNGLVSNKSDSSIDNHKNRDISSDNIERIESNGGSIMSIKNHEITLPLKKNLTSTPSRDINEDLDNLMEQISKEMTPQLPRDNNGVFQQDYTDSFVSARESQSHSISDERVTVDRENRVPRSGYLKKYLDSNAENNIDNNETDSSDNTNDDTLSFTDSIKYQANNNHVDVEMEKKEELESGNDYDNILSDEDFKFHNEKLRESILETSSEEDNINISSDEINNHNENEHVYGGDEDINNHIEMEGRDEKGNLEISKSGYFSKTIQNDQQNSVSDDGSIEEEEEGYVEASSKNDFTEDTDDDEQKDKDEESLSIPETVNDGSTINIDSTTKIEKCLDNIKDNRDEQLVPADDDNDERDKHSIVKGNDTDTNDDNESVISFKHETFVTMNKKSEQTTEEEGNFSDDNDAAKTTESWKPDTEPLRSEFVQETVKTVVPPPGFIVDENGKLVDLTPSSMKPRVVSTYSEIESGWNVFPTNYSGDSVELETIHDTKTLYDNSTIYNVPGLLTNNQNLPPLPDKVNLEMSEGIVGRDKNTTLNHQIIPTPSNGLNDPLAKGSASNSVRMNTTNDNIHVSKNIPRIDLHNSIPETDINQVILSKTSHSSKLEQLNSYYETLSRYDTGLQLWVQHSLNMPKEEKEAILDYKQGKIVKEAYANAEELSKRHTVSNTMASVNQNVNHLKKKVLQHTMNPKTLFSSIGKGVKL